MTRNAAARSADEPGRLEDRFAHAIDGVLHLLDRQILDSEGAFLGKVDDVELSDQDGALVITGVLTGPAALLDRFGGALGRVLVERWGQMRVSEPRRTTPWRIATDDIDRLDSALHLRVRRDGVLIRDRERRRLGRLTGMDVHGPDGVRLGRVLDARFEPRSDAEPGGDAGRLVLSSLIVGHGRPGSLLGYDRSAERGPLLVRAAVRWWHRHTVIVAAEVADIDWDEACVRLRARATDRPGHPFR